LKATHVGSTIRLRIKTPGPHTFLTFSIIFFSFFLLSSSGLTTDEDSNAITGWQNIGAGFPLIASLESRDSGFKQFIADVENNRRRIFVRGKENPTFFAELLTVYRYIPTEGETIFSLSARCNIPYSALASINRLSHSLMMEEGVPMLLPTCPGIFIPETPQTDFERLLAAGRVAARETEASAVSIKRNRETETFYFFPGAEFNTSERLFFLNSGFRFPLRSFRLTSGYGIRQSPITGNAHLHKGIDMAAPAGTEVFAVAEGIVTEIGEDSVYGKYIVIKHGEKWASLYGHLQKVEIRLKSTVRSSTLIGRVGSTGLSTGPHLHFELRENGKAQDPGKYLFQ
jgi:murein DD-endopeptidase MepM/ murein hydrolase activator NlpD